MTRDKLLTISILASNRKNTMEKCLASLKPLLDMGDSELIIIDTGCDKETLDIIEKYTNQIYPFTWCNDFAKARNEGLMRAKGKWFMYLDDDEWFEDVSEIVGFFTSGEYQKYHSATYLVRNYENFKGKLWRDSVASRMIELREDTRFVSSIHETFNVIFSPVKAFRAYAHHYGYVYKSREEKERHDWRNLKLLENEYKNNNRDMRIVAHLAQEYLNVKRYGDIEKVYKEMKPEELSSANNIYYGNVASVYFVEALRRQKRYEEQLERIELLKGYEFVHQVARAKMDALGIEACYFQKQYETGLRYLEEYEHVKKEYEKNPDVFRNRRGLILDACFTQRNYESALGYGILCALAGSDGKNARMLLGKMDWEAEQLYLPGDYVQELISIMKGDFSENDYTDFCNLLFSRTGMEGIFVREVSKQYFTVTSEEKKNLRKNLRRIESEKSVIGALRILYAEENEIEEEWQKEFEKIWKDSSNVLMFMERWGLWDIFEEKGIDLGSLLKGVHYAVWCNSVCSWYKTASYSRAALLTGLFEEIPEDNLYRKYWNVKMSERELLNKYLELSFQELLQYLEMWSHKITELYRGIYQDVVFEQVSSILPDECQFAMTVSEVIEKVKHQEYQTVTKVLREKEVKYKNLHAVWRNFLEKLKENITKEERTETEKQQEALRQEIVSKVYYFLDIKEYTQALDIVRELMKFYADDPELKKLENTLRELRG